MSPFLMMAKNYANRCLPAFALFAAVIWVIRRRDLGYSAPLAVEQIPRMIRVKILTFKYAERRAFDCHLAIVCSFDAGDDQ
jgi:hypothetical protein